MSFRSITRQTLDLLYPNVRVPGLSPGAVPPSPGDAAAASDPDFAVADDLIRVIPFQRVQDGPLASQYLLRSVEPVAEPAATSTGAGAPWVPGATIPFGQELEPVGSRFKKFSALVRVDELMASEANDDVLLQQTHLAGIGIVRAVGRAVAGSNPPNDDDSTLAGLPFYLEPGGSQDVLYDPACGLMAGLAEIATRVRPGGDGLGAHPTAFFMPPRTRALLFREHWDRNLQPETRWCPMVERDELYFFALPVLGARLPEPQSATPTTEAWALCLTGPSAVRVLHVGGDAFGLREDPVTTVADVGPAGEAVSATRGVDVYGIYSLLVPDPKSIARLRGIPAGDPFA